MEVSARFADKNEVLNEQQYNVMDTEVGKLYLPRDSVYFGEKIGLAHWSFLWINGVCIYGVKAVA
ncbi:MAG: hypothetical protein K6C08_03150 [Oscillospiraceae bacterium]|nr:hypothetical protein [Oscillospiraceae bacterium]